MSSDDEYIDDDLFGNDDDVYRPAPPRQPLAGSSNNVGRGGAANRGRGRGLPSGFNALGGDPMAAGGLGGMFQNVFGAGRGGLGGAMFTGGHPMMRPAASSWKKNYRAYSTAILEIKQGRGDHGGGRANLHNGGKSASHRLNVVLISRLMSVLGVRTVVMPQDALMELTDMEMESPYMFEVRNLDPGKRELFTHCGVLEFIADPGTVHLPPWVRPPLRHKSTPVRLLMLPEVFAYR